MATRKHQPPTSTNALVSVMLPRHIVEGGQHAIFWEEQNDGRFTWSADSNGSLYAHDCPHCMANFYVAYIPAAFCPYCGAQVDPEKATSSRK